MVPVLVEQARPVDAGTTNVAVIVRTVGLLLLKKVLVVYVFVEPDTKLTAPDHAPLAVVADIVEPSKYVVYVLLSAFGINSFEPLSSCRPPAEA